jgi:hypothetical protein
MRCKRNEYSSFKACSKEMTLNNKNNGKSDCLWISIKVNAIRQWRKPTEFWEGKYTTSQLNL